MQARTGDTAPLKMLIQVAILMVCGAQLISAKYFLVSTQGELNTDGHDYKETIRWKPKFGDDPKEKIIHALLADEKKLDIALKLNFKRLDTDKNRKISQKEMEKSMEKPFKTFIKQLDKNKDGG